MREGSGACFVVPYTLVVDPLKADKLAGKALTPKK